MLMSGSPIKVIFNFAVVVVVVVVVCVLKIPEKVI